MENNNNPEEHLRGAIASVLGSEIKIKKSNMSVGDLNKSRFERIINALAFVKEREIVLKDHFDTREYNKPFFELIDDLMEWKLNSAQIKLIHFYLWDRYNVEEQEMKVLHDETTDKEIKLDTSDDLWIALNRYK